MSQNSMVQALLTSSCYYFTSNLTLSVCFWSAPKEVEGTFSEGELPSCQTLMCAVACQNKLIVTPNVPLLILIMFQDADAYKLYSGSRCVLCSCTSYVLSKCYAKHIQSLRRFVKYLWLPIYNRSGPGL